MKLYLWLFVLVSFLTITSCKKEENSNAQQIYFNSFEFQSDVAGWQGNAFTLSNDVPANGGKKSLYVSGGSVFPHAECTIKPQNTESYLTLKFWGKNLSNGGAVYLYVNDAGFKEISFEVSEKEWTLYESKDSLFCPPNTSMTLGVIAGGISSSAILVDMIEIRKLNVSH